MEILSAIKLLNKANDEDWTADGLPAVGRLSQLCGHSVTRAQITEAAPTLTRATAPDIETEVENVEAVSEEVSNFDLQLRSLESISDCDTALSQLYEQRDILLDVISKVQKVRDGFVTDESKVAKEDPIATFLASERDNLSKKAEVIKNVSKTGFTALVKQVSDAVKPSLIDQALAVRG